MFRKVTAVQQFMTEISDVCQRRRKIVAITKIILNRMK
jgi:hypothetical protein